MMKKEDIQKLRIDVVVDGQSALSMLLDRDGRISRQGSGEMPADSFAVMSENDGSIFSRLLEAMDERAFEHTGVYDHPNKAGMPITYSIAFLGKDIEDVAVFEFRLGTETQDVGELLPFFVQFIANAVQATDDWYKAEKGLAAAKGEA